MVTLVIEFGRQRRKFNLIPPINIDLINNEIKSSFGIKDENKNEYLIQIYDEQIDDYLDLTLDQLKSTNKNLFKGQIISTHLNSLEFQIKVTKQQIVGLITLESIEVSLEKWSNLLQSIQSDLSKELQIVKETIHAVKSHYKLIDETNNEENLLNDSTVTTSHSFSNVSQISNKDFSLLNDINPTNSKLNQSIQHIQDKNISKSFDSTNFNKEKSQINYESNRRGNNHKNISIEREFNHFYPPSHIPIKRIEYHIPITVAYQRFQSGVNFEGYLSKYYNPTYFFIRIFNQTESYDEMHKNINLYYNNIDLNQSYFPQSGEFCVAKASSDLNWYRARIIRIIDAEKVQLIFIDIGEIAEININLIQPLVSEFNDRPAQALACTMAHVLPFAQNNECGWNRRACMSLEHTMKHEHSTNGNALLKVTVADNNQIKWPMMFVNMSTSSIPNLSEYICDLYLSRRCSNLEISEFWSNKIRPEQYVLFNLSSLINQKQYFTIHNNYQTILTVDQTIDLIISDLEFSRR